MVVLGFGGVVGRVWLVVLACVGLAVGLVACGGSGDGGGSGASDSGSSEGSGARVVVSFGGQRITQAEFEHWVGIEAVLTKELYPSTPPPPGEIPDPPKYTKCVAYELASVAPHKPPIAALRKACRQRDQQVRQHMLQLLISYLWMDAEARAHGINVTPTQLKQAYQRYNREIFHGEAGAATYRHASGQTVADEMKLVKFDVQLNALREKLLRELGQQRIGAFYHQYPRQLAAVTSCAPGYVIPECKQYKGPEPPSG